MCLIRTTCCTSRARQTNKVHVFAATDLEQAKAQCLDDAEAIEFLFLRPPAIAEAIHAGQFSQALRIASYYRGQSHLAG